MLGLRSVCWRNVINVSIGVLATGWCRAMLSLAHISILVALYTARRHL